MKKIPSLFKRNYDGDRLVYDEVVEGCEWVLKGIGYHTVKLDGTACLVDEGVLYKRYDRRRKRGKLKPAPPGWVPCEDAPNEHTGHWPGWVPVGEGPEDKWHREAFEGCGWVEGGGSCELIGPKIQGNPHGLDRHMLVPHGCVPEVLAYSHLALDKSNPRTFIEIRDHLAGNSLIEGIVWWDLASDRRAKIKRRDFGLPWPFKEDASE